MSEETPNPEGGEVQETFPPLPKRPKAKHKHAHHGGAWKVAYADFITTMMALFLLLWLISTSDQASRAMMSLYFRDPGIFDNPQGANAVPGSGAAVKTKPAPILEVSGSGGGGQRNIENTINMEQMSRALQKSAAKTGSQRGVERQVNMLPSRDGFQLQLSDSEDFPAFEPGSAVLTKDAEQMVAAISEVMAALTNFSITLSGYTDAKPNGNLKYDNRELSADRAQRVMQLMVANGVPPERFREVAGYGSLYPVDLQDPFAPRNRRVVITLKNMRDSGRATKLPGQSGAAPRAPGTPPTASGASAGAPGAPAAAPQAAAPPAAPASEAAPPTEGAPAVAP